MTKAQLDAIARSRARGAAKGGAASARTRIQRVALVRRTRLATKTRLKRNVAIRKAKPQTMDEYLDDLCRRIVLLRDQFKCRVCHASKGRGDDRIVLQAHHIRTKGAHPSLRFELDNLLTVYKGCHMFKLHGRDTEWAAQWYRRELGQAHLDKLELMIQVRKGKKLDKQAIKLYLEQFIPPKGEESVEPAE